MKICKQCGNKKEVSLFYKNKGRFTGKCKVCINELNRKYRIANKEKISNHNKKIYQANREDVCLKATARYHENPTAGRRKSKEWVKNNPDKVRENRVKWSKVNQERLTQIARKSNKKIRSTIRGKLKLRISGGIRKALRSGKQGRKWESLVGYNLDELKRHLERKFLPGMSWGNIDQWHIDHITPISAFNYQSHGDIDFKKCWCLKNLQPMWAVDNMKKHDKLSKPFQPSLAIAI